MEVINYIRKGVVPVVWFLILTYLGRYFCIVDGQVDWFRVMMLYGIPYGFPYLFLYVPRWGSISGGIGALAMEVIIAATFGFLIAVFAAAKAAIYMIVAPIYFGLSHRKR